MKRWVILIALLCLLACAACDNGNMVQAQAALEKVSDVFTIPVPQPQVLPSGFTLDKVALSDNNTALLLYTNGGKAELELKMDWFPGGGIPYRIDSKSPDTIKLQGFSGELKTVNDRRRVAWNLQYYGRETTGLMICYLFTTSEISDEELAEIAASVGWE